AHYRHRVVHIDEIALLLAVRDTFAMRLEQADRPAGTGVVESLGDQAHHRALVVLVRAEHVEELASRPLRRHLLLAYDALDERQIEQVLAPAVKIQWLEALERRSGPFVRKSLLASTIGRRRGCVDERRARFGTPIEQ